MRRHKPYRVCLSRKRYNSTWMLRGHAQNHGLSMNTKLKNISKHRCARNAVWFAMKDILQGIRNSLFTRTHSTRHSATVKVGANASCRCQ